MKSSALEEDPRLFCTDSCRRSAAGSDPAVVLLLVLELGALVIMMTAGSVCLALSPGPI